MTDPEKSAAPRPKLDGCPRCGNTIVVGKPCNNCSSEAIRWRLNQASKWSDHVRNHQDAKDIAYLLTQREIVLADLRVLEARYRENGIRALPVSREAEAWVLAADDLAALLARLEGQ